MDLNQTSKPRVRPTSRLATDLHAVLARRCRRETWDSISKDLMVSTPTLRKVLRGQPVSPPIVNWLTIKLTMHGGSVAA